MSQVSLPSGWINLKFTDILDVQGGTQPPKSEFISEKQDGYIRLLQIRDFGKKPVPTFIPESKKLKKCSKQDLLIGRYGASLGRICTGQEGAYNVALAKVIYPKEIFLSYIRYYLESEEFQSPLRLLSRSAQNGFNKEDLSKFIFLLPPYAEQKIIADKLDDLLARVESIKTRLENIPEILKRFRQSVLSTEFDYEIDDFSSLKNMELKDICRSISDGDHQAPPKSNSGIPFLVISDVNKGVVDFDNVVRRVPLEYYENLKDIRKPDEKDILYTVTGSFGIPVVITDNAKFCFQRHIAIIKPNHELIFYKYLYFYLKSPEVFKYAQRVATGTAQKTVSLSNLRKFKIRLPSIFLQKKVVRKIEALFLYADTIEKKSIEAMKNINQLTQSILAKAFRGELTAQWREENPELISGINSAEALLEKITAEKLAAGTIKKRAKKSSH
ncbi:MULTISPECIES: restriction endonuclease subunit S [Enterobacterales]|uniref:restriction endonuclease subunit S n=1 Tax=Enterobacterales TaxID=91347 RepID=UPI000808B15D|nr:MULTISPECIES: restriction endonuclease subunit S [Enterobacterales]HCI6528351.1 restriction endonuclease subunit S [Klebsiella quasipneumoniae subsp. quasipneumoniae]MCG7368622.1 restriction endonuclease subunit S [Pantoea sp. ACRSH]MCG7398985.1 restriction endonuclease subunit S [Pantoea sp. ACRSC]MCH9491512.1 restriction endonuclease subunit S [Klebsiella pneumoniae]MCH9502196.1 restriction endonuclease subunit S [Klebsiella pneumoniae]